MVLAQSVECAGSVCMLQYRICLKRMSFLVPSRVYNTSHEWSHFLFACATSEPLMQRYRGLS